MALNPISIPLVITKDQKQQLFDLGYKKAQINKMKPEEAHEILGIKNQVVSESIFPQNSVEIPEKFQPPDAAIQIPSKPDAEKLLIGALLFNQSKELWASVVSEIVPGHFHLESHQKIYQAMISLLEKDEIPDLVTVIDELRRTKQISKVGREAYLSELMIGQYRRSSLTGEIRLIRSAYRSRWLLNFTQQVQKRIFAGDEDGEEILEAIRTEIGSLNGHAKYKIQSVCAADVEPTRVTWLWKNRVPLKAFSLMQGIEGIGKSTLLCELVAGVTAMKSIEALEISEAGKVLWLSAEDDIAEDLVPRLMSAGADLKLVQIIDQAFSLDDKGVILLKSEIEKHRPMLVIIDPLYAFSKGSPNNEEDARIITNHFKVISRDFMCAIVGVRHVNKSKGFGDPRAAGSGSVAWQAAARSVLMVGFDPDNPAKCAIMPTKGNKGDWRNAEALGYEIRSDITSASGAKFFWTGKSDLTAKKILQTATDDEREDREERKQAKNEMREFLKAILSAGPVLVSEVEKQAEAAGLSVSYLRKKRGILGAKPVQKGGGNNIVHYLEWTGTPEIEGQSELNFEEKNNGNYSDISKNMSEYSKPDNSEALSALLPFTRTMSDYVPGDITGTNIESVRVKGKRGSKPKKTKGEKYSDTDSENVRVIDSENSPENPKTHCQKCGARLEENGQCDYCTGTEK